MRTAPITSRSSADLDDLVGPFTAYAPALQRVPGIVFKTRIQDGETPGGFRVFTDRHATDAYLASELAAGMTANAAFSEFANRHCAVREELTGRTGSLRLAAQGGG